MMFFKKTYKDKNRKRLQNLVSQTLDREEPSGWKKTIFAVGGLSEIGFSKRHPHLLLVISSQGRGVIDCDKSVLIERDNNTTFEWFNTYELTAQGIGILSEEVISISGLSGGGLPLMNKYGDGLQYMATEWPIIDIIFEPDFKSIYKDNETQDCFRIFHDHELRAHGFSYDGETCVIATSSEISVYRKQQRIIHT